MQQEYLMLLDQQEIEQMTAEYKERYERNRLKKGLPIDGADSFLEHGVRVLYKNINQDFKRYRLFGVYWYALKALFVQRGLDFGLGSQFAEEIDETIRNIYKGQTDEQTIVLAESFFDEMSQHYSYDHRDYMITDEGQMYTLNDSKMEEIIYLDQRLADYDFFDES